MSDKIEKAIDQLLSEAPKTYFDIGHGYNKGKDHYIVWVVTRDMQLKQAEGGSVAGYATHGTEFSADDKQGMLAKGRVDLVKQIGSITNLVEIPSIQDRVVELLRNEFPHITFYIYDTYTGKPEMVHEAKVKRM